MHLEAGDSLLLITSAAHGVDVYAKWEDHIGAELVNRGRTASKPTTATTTTILAQPADPSATRVCKQLDITNVDSSNTNIVTVEHTDGTTTVQLFSVSLAHGDNLHYTPESGWVVRLASGAFVNSI